VFDGPAADQDPEFRRRFYQEILPRLQAEGRTLVIASHDDPYFGHAGRIVTLRDGKILADPAAPPGKAARP
jgi:ABC-type siderophore export system fused ATPase/permease subunit